MQQQGGQQQPDGGFAVARARVVHRDEGTVVALEGEVDLYARDDLVRVFYEEVDHRLAASVTVDLSGATFVDSTMLGELLRFRSWLARRGVELRIVGASHEVRRTFEITGLDRLFALAPADEKAP